MTKVLTGYIAEWCVVLLHYSRRHDMRTGQAMFNHLPTPVATVVRGSLFDPFYHDFTYDEMYDWMDNHLIFGDVPAHGPAEIIGVFDGNNLLWSAT